MYGEIDIYEGWNLNLQNKVVGYIEVKIVGVCKIDIDVSFGFVYYFDCDVVVEGQFINVGCVFDEGNNFFGNFNGGICKCFIFLGF